MAFAHTGHHDRPMMEMNTTPLIDVLLVLLIMFIMTIPAATHSFEFDLPSDPSRPALEIRQVNRLVLTSDDRILWNGGQIDQVLLGATLTRIASIPYEPEVRFEPDAAASYNLAAQVLDTVKRSGVGNFGFVGNERFAQFGKPVDTQ